jgi:predicted HicB family RNase H-like nuclease
VALKVKPLSFDDFLTRNNRAMEKQGKTKPGTTTVRLPPALHAAIKEAAAKAGHSMNDEIILRLDSYARAMELGDIAQQNMELQRMVQRLIDRLC